MPNALRGQLRHTRERFSPMHSLYPYTTTLSRGGILNMNLMELAAPLKFFIIWDVDYEGKRNFDVALREHEAQGTLFFTK